MKGIWDIDWNSYDTRHIIHFMPNGGNDNYVDKTLCGQHYKSALFTGDDQEGVFVNKCKKCLKILASKQPKVLA
jgi:hypothetical protein